MLEVPAGATSVLVREYTDGNWQAKLGGRVVPVLEEGPDMMLIDIPRAARAHEVTIVLTPHLDKVELAGDALAVLADLALLAYALGAAGPLGRLARRLLAKRLDAWALPLPDDTP